MLVSAGIKWSSALLFGAVGEHRCDLLDTAVMSLDGYIAGPNGEYDWILMDPDLPFAEIMAQFDTFLIGRKTFELMQRMGNAEKAMPGTHSVVFSRTLNPADYPLITIHADAVRFVTELRSKPGKDIAIFGGGELFRSLLEAGLVDRVECRSFRCSWAVGFRCFRHRPRVQNSSSETSAYTQRPAPSFSNTILFEV